MADVYGVPARNLVVLFLTLEQGDEGDLDDDDLGDDAIDLAQALDQSDDESLGEDDASASGSDDESTATSSDEEDEEDDDMVDPEKVGALQSLVTKYAEDGKKDNAPKQRQKIDLSDLGLSAVNDPQIRKSVKIMSKEDREVRPGTIKKKLEVPLARRQQDKVLRSAAYDKTNETLDRWTETVKLNRRAEHLVFPLPQNLPGAGLDNSEIRPLTEKNASNELESTIMSIMEQSGLLVKPDDAKKGSNGDDEEAQGLSKLELQSLWSERRRERELNSRETQRAKRIKKIKSKAYHRVHRKARQKEEIKLREAMEEAGEIDSEEEREAQDRKRALERVGARHRDSKWAKSGSKMKRAVWDDDFRTGVHEMAQKNEDLRRRKEGRAGVSGSEDEDDDDESSGSESDNDRLLQQLDKVADADDGAPQSKLMQLKFMQRAEEALKKFNDDAIDQIRRDLGSDPEDEGSEEEVDIGRRSFGMAKAGAKTAALFGGGANREGARSGRRDVVTNEAEQALTDGAASGGAKKGARIGLSSSSADATADPTAGAWSKGEVRRKSKKGSSANAKNEALDLNADILVAEQPRSAKSRAQQPSEAAHPAEDDAGSEDEAELHLPLAIRDRELVARAFAGEDVVGDFAAEKAIVAEADDDKIVDETLPGWGSWVGDGLSAREQAKNKGRWLKTVQGVKKKDRKDAKLDKVIINEKTVKKVCAKTPHLHFLIQHPPRGTIAWTQGMLTPCAEQQVSGLSAAASLRVQGAVRTLSTTPRRPRMADQGDLHRCHEAANHRQAGHHHADCQASPVG